MKSTNPNGSLIELQKCYLFIPNFGKIILNNLPDISDSKSAIYNEESVIGRSSPLHTYSYSGTRQLSINFHFHVVEEGDVQKNLSYLRAIASCVYTQEDDDVPFKPPVVCTFRCGDVLADKDLCVVLQNYSYNLSTDVVWDEETYFPYKLDINTTWWVVYSSNNLPFASRIITSGY